MSEIEKSYVQVRPRRVVRGVNGLVVGAAGTILPADHPAVRANPSAVRPCDAPESASRAEGPPVSAPPGSGGAGGDSSPPEDSDAQAGSQEPEVSHEEKTPGGFGHANPYGEDLED